jgi:hypothetical protein
MKYRHLGLEAAALLLLVGCSGGGGEDDGYTLYQTVFIDRGTPHERRLQVMEDARLTPGMRDVMWEGPKQPAEIASALGLDAADPSIKALSDPPIRPAMLRLSDATGKVLAERRFDCPLGALNPSPLPQGKGAVWALGIDCHTATGVYEGLVTRFFTVADDKFVWQKFRRPGDGAILELTLLDSPKIAWVLASPGRAEDILEVSGQPDMDHLAANGVPIGTIVEYVRYRFQNGVWQRTERQAPGDWQQSDGFPPEARFPK